MPPPAQQQQGQGDNALGPVWIMAGIFLGIWAAWWFGHTQISHGVVALRYYEAIFISYFTSSIDPLITKINSLTPEAYTALDPGSLGRLSTQVGNYFKYPVLILFVILGIWSYYRNPQVKFRKSYNTEGLLKEDVVDWPQTTPVVDLNLIKDELDVGPWAAAQTPLWFARKHGLFQEVRAESAEPILKHRAQYSIVLLPEKAYRVFCMQLGKPWSGVENLNPHTKALFAIFVTRANGKLDEARAMLNQISRSSSTPKLNFEGIEGLIKKYQGHQKIQKIIQSHHYVLTVMASMLRLAREDGVLSTSEFLWLKPTDRRLWYMLNSVGRQTPFVEVGGAFSHWLTELELGEKIITPMVAEAVRGLELALKDIAYNPNTE